MCATEDTDTRLKNCVLGILPAETVVHGKGGDLDKTIRVVHNALIQPVRSRALSAVA